MKKHKILIVVDMQNDFVTGPLGTKEAVNVVQVIKNKIEDGDYDNVVFTKDTHGENYLSTLEGTKLPVAHCIEGTNGWEIVPELKDLCSCNIVKKTFGFTGWYAWFNEEDEVELCGVCTDICVVSNALALRMYYPNMKISVDPLACAGTTPERHRQALGVMESCQIDIKL